MKLGGQGDCRRRDRRWEVPATSRRKQRRPWFNTTTERIRPRHVHVGRWVFRRSAGARAEAFSRQSGHFRETHRRGTGSHRLVGGTVSGRGSRGAGQRPLSGGQLRGDRSTQPGRGEAVGCGEMDVPNAPVSGGVRCFRGCPIHKDNADGRLDPSVSRQPAHRPRAAVPPTPLRFGPTPPGQPSRPSPPLLHHCLLHRR